MVIDRSSHNFMSTTNMNMAGHHYMDQSADKKSDMNITKSKASILDDTISANKSKKYFAEDDDELV
jgi:hypothetical protein